MDLYTVIYLNLITTGEGCIYQLKNAPKLRESA